MKPNSASSNLSLCFLSLLQVAVGLAPCNCPPESNSQVQLWLQAQKGCLSYQQSPGWSSCMAFELGWMSSAAQFYLNFAKINDALTDLASSSCDLSAVTPFEAVATTSNTWMWPGRYDYQGLDEALAELIQCTFAKAKACQADSYRRTIVIVKKKTVPGQDLFIIGGRADGGPIDIRVNAMPNQFDKYNAWSLGDSQLDWKGMQDGQALFNNWKALGSPLAWTTNDTHNPYFSTLNYDTGDHAWVIDMDMNCAESDDGWFEFKTIYSYGGESGEPGVTQEYCSGPESFTPKKSTNHVAKCGAINVFTYGDNKCNIMHLSC